MPQRFRYDDEVLIRPEIPDDYAVIAELNCAAFNGSDEAILIDRLRSESLVIASLVAVDETGKIIGHILFSPVRIVTSEGRVFVCASLAPMAVLPEYHGKGIGSKLVEQGIEACRADYKAIIVVGHPAYYPRFGFSHDMVSSLVNPFAADEAFMGLELVPGFLSGIEGRVVYPAAFSTFQR